jgi:hypothetical protein
MMTDLGIGSVRVVMQIGAIESSCVVESLKGRQENVVKVDSLRTRGAHPSSGCLAMDESLGFEEVAEGDLAPLSPVAGHLVAAERSLGVFARAVDVDDAGFQPGGDLSGMGVRRRLHVGRQAINRVIGDGARRGPP